MIITLDLPPEFEVQLRQAAVSQGKDISTFLLDSARQHLQDLRRDVLSVPETALLRTINVPLAPEARHRRDILFSFQAQRDLTDDEQGELAQLIDAVEMANAARWQAIAELAKRRGQSLREIAADLQIPLP